MLESNLAIITARSSLYHRVQVETDQQSAGGIFFKFPLSPAPISRKSLRITTVVPYNVILVALTAPYLPLVSQSASDCLKRTEKF